MRLMAAVREMEALGYRGFRLHTFANPVNGEHTHEVAEVLRRLQNEVDQGFPRAACEDYELRLDSPKGPCIVLIESNDTVTWETTIYTCRR